MEIKYFGHSTFYIKGKQASIVTDPYTPEEVGLKFPKHTISDVVTISHAHSDHNDVTQIEGSPFVIQGPGEYEIKGISIIGIGSYHDAQKGQERGKNTMYRIEMDGLNLVHLGDLGHELNESDLENLGGVDILFIPVGGFYTINASQAKTIITEIEPTIVIPMHYGRADLKPEMKTQLADLSVFLKEMSKEGLVPQPKLTITKDKLPEEMQVIILE